MDLARVVVEGAGPKGKQAYSSFSRLKDVVRAIRQGSGMCTSVPGVASPTPEVNVLLA